MKHLSRFAIVLSGVLGCGMVSPAWANRYRIVDLGGGDSMPGRINDFGVVSGRTPQGIAAIWFDEAWHELAQGSSMAYGINERGQSVGTTDSQAVLWKRDMSQIVLRLPRHAASGEATSIANTGFVAGTYRHRLNNGPILCFLRTPDGRVLDLEVNKTNCTPYEVNDVGEVVGDAYFPEGDRAFLWRKGKMHDLGTLGGSWSAAKGINALGEVVGVSETPDHPGIWHAVLWRGGRMIDLSPSPDYEQGNATSINAGGTIVGDAQLASEGFAQEAVRFEEGRVVRLADEVEDLGAWHLLSAFDVNDRGAIVGWGNRSDGRHTFLLVPVH